MAGTAEIERPLTGILKSDDGFGAPRPSGWPSQVEPVADADHLPKRTLGIGDLEQAFAALAG